MWAFFKRVTFAGIFAIVPIALTFYIIKIIIIFLNQLTAPFLERIQIEIPGLGVLLTILIIFALGIFVTNVLGRKLFSWAEKLISSINVKAKFGYVKVTFRTLISPEYFLIAVPLLRSRGIFTKSDERFDTPNIEFHVQPLSLDKFGDPLHNFPALTVSVCNLRPKSRGTVSLMSSNPMDQPKIAPNYLTDPEDKEVAVESIKKARNLMATKRMAIFEPDEFLPGKNINKHKDLFIKYDHLNRK